ncbi:hypothetical protein [Streptomyces sp. NPDC096132]|uniref:hypothetical protein n=1 Tax=Streptomyces sp. NPDC096132 TaxID=3366075 RepID=UPI003801A603
MEPEAEARVRLGLARMSGQCDFTEAARLAAAGVALPGIPASLKAQLLGLRALDLSMVGDDEVTAHAVSDALEAAAQAQDKAAEATAVAVDSVVRFYRMDWTAAFACADRASALAAEVGFARRGDPAGG